MNKISRTMTLVFFFAALLILPVLTVISSKTKFSDIENRALAVFPKLSAQNVADRDYMKGIESFLSDHFTSRTSWIELKTTIELISGKKETNGVYILPDRFVEKLDTPNYKEVDKSINAINKFAEKIKSPVYVMIAPTATGIYSEELPKNAPKFDQKAFIEYIYSNLNSGKVATLDAYSALFPTRDEYIYYRNDHHWTTLGAYYAYASTIKKMGFSPILANRYDIEHASNEFKGTLYSKALYNGFQADSIDFWHLNGGVNVTSLVVDSGAQKKSYDSMYFRDYLTKKDKYSSFLGTNQPIVTINTDSPNKNKLLVIKDSFAHCFVPFLTQHYSEITMVDLRYISTGLDQVVNLSDYDQVLFLYNASTFSTDENIKKLNFVK